VSSRFRQIHLDYPPHRKKWKIVRDFDKSLVEWFMHIAGRIEILKVHGDSYFLPQMLMAAVGAPNLQRLCIRNIDSPVLHSLSFLSQIRELSLNLWHFPEGSDGAGMQCLTGLQSLTVGLPNSGVIQFLSHEQSRPALH
jgi:hypothetical protein